jgi:hypothetical protein
MGRRGIATWAALAVVLLVVLVVASSGTVHLWQPLPPPAVDGSVDPALETYRPEGSATSDTPAPPTSRLTENPIEKVLAVVVFAALLYLAVVVISFWISVLRRRLRRRRADEEAFDALPVVPEAVVVLDIDAHRRLLLDGPARNAIVACWMQLEADAARAGLPRDPAETSAEYTTRVVAAASIDPAPISALAALYREARFSAHDMGDAERDLAAAALERVHAALVRADVGAVVRA